MDLHLVFPRSNDALRNNPPAGDAHITTHASDWLWAVFAIMLLSWLTVLVWTFTVRPLFPLLATFLHFPQSRRHTRIFHFIPMIVLAVATVTYFAMASDLGWTLIRSEFDSHPTRQIWVCFHAQI